MNLTVKQALFIVTLLAFMGCRGPKTIAVATEGEVVPKTFNTEIPFAYHDHQLFVTVGIGGQSYTFLYDTGTEITLVDPRLLNEIDFKPSVKTTLSGSSIKKQKVQLGFVPELSMQGVAFKDIGLMVLDLDFVKSRSPEGKQVDGILGTNIFRKAYWQIDYQEEVIRASDKLPNLPVGESPYVLNLQSNNQGWGLSKLKVTLGDTAMSFIFDTGSGGELTISTDAWDKLSSKVNSKEVSTASDKEKKWKYFNLNGVKVGEVTLEETSLLVDEGVSPLLGNQFWEDYRVTMDWGNEKVYLTPLQ